MATFDMSNQQVAHQVNVDSQEQPNCFKQIEQMHQQVREFVEKEHPAFRVVSVDGRSTTNYVWPPHRLGETPDTFLSDIRLRFSTESCQLTTSMHLRCEVLVTSDGTLIIDSPTLSMSR